MFICKFCNKEFDKSGRAVSAHIRWCDLNPNVDLHRYKLSEKNKNQIPWNKDKKWSKRNKFSPGMIGKKHSEETKKLISDKALSSKHRRLVRKMINYNDIWLDSSWELELAKRLDYLNIEWIRPDPIEWFDKYNKKHNYFSDFYLPKYNLYIDPKNPRAYKVQEEKIKILMSGMNNLIILHTLDECKNFTLRG